MNIRKLQDKKQVRFLLRKIAHSLILGLFSYIVVSTASLNDEPILILVFSLIYFYWIYKLETKKIVDHTFIDALQINFLFLPMFAIIYFFLYLFLSFSGTLHIKKTWIITGLGMWWAMIVIMSWIVWLGWWILIEKFKKTSERFEDKWVLDLYYSSQVIITFIMAWLLIFSLAKNWDLDNKSQETWTTVEEIEINKIKKELENHHKK